MTEFGMGDTGVGEIHYGFAKGSKFGDVIIENPGTLAKKTNKKSDQFEKFVEVGREFVKKHPDATLGQLRNRLANSTMGTVSVTMNMAAKVEAAIGAKLRRPRRHVGNMSRTNLK
jgi:hypothetical protein